MTPQLQLLRAGLLAAAGLALGGCDTPGRPAAAPPPQMPTVGRAPAPPAAHLGEAEVTAAAVQWVRQGEVAPAVRAIDGAGETLPRSRIRVEVTTIVARDDPARAAAFALALVPGPTRTTCVEVAARAWCRRDADAALGWAMSLADPATADVARRAVATEWVGRAPRELIDRLTAPPAGGARDDTLVIAAAAWAKVSPDAALAWLDDVPAGALKERLTSGIAFEIAQTNPRRALTLAETMPAARDRWLLVTAIAQTWVAVDASAALAWAGGLPAGAPRDAAMAGVETGLGVPVARRGPVVPNTQSGSSRTRGGGAAVSPDWPEMSSPEFAAWLATQPPGMSRDEAVQEYVRQRSAGSGGEVAEWVISLQNGPTRGRAIQTYVDSLLPRYPDEAARWLRSLPSADQDPALIEKVVRQWLVVNAAAAEAWLMETTMPYERKQLLLKQAGR
jgi:hypothetical protein